MRRPTLFILTHSLKDVGNGLCAVPHPKGRNRYRQPPAPENTVQKLPLRGSWQGAALTDEGRGNVKRSRNCRRIRRNVPPLCHSDGRVSGVEESTTWQKVQTQGKICHLRGFLDSLRSLGMTCRGVILFFSPQVQHPPWRAAGCRPYDTFVTNYRVFNVSIIVLRP